MQLDAEFHFLILGVTIECQRKIKEHKTVKLQMRKNE